jgi:hypothetical protein
LNSGFFGEKNKCAIAVRRIGTERDRVCSIIIACCGGIDIVSLTGFAACVELAECVWSMHEWMPMNDNLNMCNSDVGNQIFFLQLFFSRFFKILNIHFSKVEAA